MEPSSPDAVATCPEEAADVHQPPDLTDDTALGRNVPASVALSSSRRTWRVLVWQRDKRFLFMSLQTSSLPAGTAPGAGPDTQANITIQTHGPAAPSSGASESPRLGRVHERLYKDKGTGSPRGLLITIYHRVHTWASFPCRPWMPPNQQRGLWVSECELLNRGRRPSKCGMCEPLSSFLTGLSVSVHGKGGRQAPAHLSGIIRPPGIRSPQGRGAPVHLREAGVWRRPCQMRPAAGLCLMGAAPDVPRSPCLFRQPHWPRHASPAPDQEGQAPEEA